MLYLGDAVAADGAMCVCFYSKPPPSQPPKSITTNRETKPATNYSNVYVINYLFMTISNGLTIINGQDNGSI